MQPALGQTIVEALALGDVKQAGSGLFLTAGSIPPSVVGSGKGSMQLGDGRLGSGLGAWLVTSPSTRLMVSGKIAVHQHPIHVFSERSQRTDNGLASLCAFVQACIIEGAQGAIQKVCEPRQMKESRGVVLKALLLLLH